MRQQTQHTKKQIIGLYQDGYSVTAIAAMTGVPPGTVRSHLRRRSDAVHSKLCPQCGSAVKRSPGHPNKKFCSDRCRMAWWNSHPKQVNKKAYYTLVCRQCGKEFDSYGNKNRKYCCRQCYAEARRHAAHT
jgi:rRNA maturation endonuclease Nob1